MDIKDLMVIYPRGLGLTRAYGYLRFMRIMKSVGHLFITDYFKDKPYISNFKINDFLNSHNKQTL